MKKFISFLLIFTLLFDLNNSLYAETPLSETRAEPAATLNLDVAKDIQKIENSAKAPQATPAEKAEVIPTELVEKVPGDSGKLGQLQEYQNDDFDEDYKPSKWEITKNVAKYFAQKFVYDLKSYVKFYPLIQVAQFITYVAWFLPGYVVYKKTGFDVISAFSEFAANHQNFAIFAQNLYNAISMTLASLIYKYGQQAFAYMRSLKI